jgi:von Willebrand factor type A domain
VKVDECNGDVTPIDAKGDMILAGSRNAFAGRDPIEGILAMTIFRTTVLLSLAFPLLMAAQEHNTCENRTLPANVVDAHGQQILGLTTDQFRAEYHGQTIKVISAKFESGAPRILLLVDTSRSVSSDPRQWELVKSVARDMVSKGPPQAKLALATFSDKFETNVRFGQDRDAVREAILGLTAPSHIASTVAGETALYDAILEAADMFGEPQSGDVVYVITDGLDNESKTTTGKVLQYLEQRNIRLFMSVIHNSRFTPLPGASDGPEIVGITARETGGDYTTLETGYVKSAIAVHQLYDLMASFYLLDLESIKAPDKSRKLKLAVVDTSGKKMKGTTVLYPQDVSLCAAPVGFK